VSKKLDRGSVFSSLMGDIKSLSSGGSEVQQVALSSIHLDRGQPRKHFAEVALENLSQSIKQHGVLEPVLLRSRGDGYELIAGERRVRAAQRAGLDTIPALILELDDAQALEVAIIENLQREDLNPLEETDALLKLLAIRLELSLDETLAILRLLYDESRGRSGNNVISKKQCEIIDGVFRLVGRFTVISFYSNRVPLLKLPEDLLEAMRDGQLDYTKARELGKVQDEETRRKLLEIVMEEKWSLKTLREAIAQRRTVQSSTVDEDERLKRIKKRLSSRQLAKLSERHKQQLDRLLRELEVLLEEFEAD